MPKQTDSNLFDSSDFKSTELGDPQYYRVIDQASCSDSIPDVSSIGRYQLLKQLGNGGFGHVYLADDPTLNRLVAIKVPRWDRPLSALATKQFLYEGQMLARLDHPGIVSVYDYGVTEDRVPYVVMQFIDGETLDQYLAKRRRAIPEMVELLVKIAEPLQAAHRRFLTHRDLKPANVIVDTGSRVHLVDFGLALHDELTPDEFVRQKFAGTTYFMSPEQMRGENHLIDLRTDVWAFGVLMYLLLTGKLPFKGQENHDIKTTICHFDPVPLTKRKPFLEPELERICLRCLEKQMDDRYQSMQEVIEDLTASLQLAGVQARRDQIGAETGWDAQALSKINSGSSSAFVIGPSRTSDNRSVRVRLDQNCSISMQGLEGVVHRGLRPYTEAEAENFLGLLPGPVDRNGLPESLEYWLSWLDSSNVWSDCPTGLIFGPSGCGKSSFVRAGLLPRLPRNVTSFYFDCNTEDLPALILNRLRMQFSELQSTPDLPSAFRSIRLGRVLNGDSKILIVLDQFEQWLSRNSDYGNQSLTEALRQCDSRRLQSICLVRDDFWLGVSAFFRGLNRRIADGSNAMALPIPDVRHARRVLVAYGRAAGALPPVGEDLTQNQINFVNCAIESLANRGRVICVHLSVFAEICKNRPWNMEEWRSIGGWEGIGREYVAGVFSGLRREESGSATSGQCWAILRALLPPSGEIRGAVVPCGELIRACGLENNPQQFDRALEFLERQVNLVSRVDDCCSPSDNVVDTRVATATTCYALTHDFLVAPIREWGKAKQHETIRGRAAARLEHLAEQWKMTGNRRVLPGIVDYCRLRAILGAAAVRADRAFWRAATRKTAISVGLATLIFFGLWFGFSTIQQQQRQIAINQWVRSVLEGPVDQHALLWRHIPASKKHVQLELAKQLESYSAAVRFRANVLLLASGFEVRQSMERILNDLPELEPADVAVLVTVLPKDWQKLRAQWIEYWGATKSVVGRARAALVMSHLGDWDAAEADCRLAENPEKRYAFVEEIMNWRGHEAKWARAIAQHIDTMDGDLLSAVATGIGLIDSKGLAADQRKECIAMLSTVFSRHPHGGAHYAAKFALGKLKAELPAADPAGIPNCEWMTVRIPASDGSRDHEIDFVRIKAGTIPGETLKGSVTTEVSVDRDFWISVNEVSGSLFFEFALTEETNNPDFGDDELSKELSKWRLFSTVDVSVGGVSHDRAARFLNWFSRQAGYSESYYDEKGTLLPITGADGFRFPTSGQFELANRACSRTPFWFGCDTRKLSQYAGVGIEAGPATGLPPNGFGVIDSIAGRQEWCEDHSSSAIKDYFVVRGGSSIGMGRECRANYKIAYPSGYKAEYIGFRIKLEIAR